MNELWRFLTWMNLFTYAKYHSTSLNNSFIMRISRYNWWEKLREKKNMRWTIQYIHMWFECCFIHVTGGPSIDHRGRHVQHWKRAKTTLHSFQQKFINGKNEIQMEKYDEKETIQQQLQLNAVTNTHNSD